MTNDESEPTKEELEQRVDQLEQTVQKMMPDRRQTLKGLGLLGGGALLGGVGSQQAEGATGSAGNVGTSSDRPDVFADTVDSNSLSTGDIENTQDPAGSPASYLKPQATDGTYYTTQTTDAVGTSAVVIHDRPENITLLSAFVLVNGERDGSDERFTDVLHISRFDGGATVLNSREANAPAARSYNVSNVGTNGDLDLAMGSDTYNVISSALWVGR